MWSQGTVDGSVPWSPSLCHQVCPLDSISLSTPWVTVCLAVLSGCPFISLVVQDPSLGQVSSAELGTPDLKFSSFPFEPLS